MVRHLLTFALLALLLGCNHRYVRPESIAPDVTHLEVRERSSGTQSACVRVGGVSWVADGRVIQVLDDRGEILRTVDLGEAGVHPPISDMLLHGHDVLVVLDGECVQVIDATDPQRPAPSQRHDARSLGMAPRRLAVIDDEPVAFGDDGAVRLSDREHLVVGVSVASMASAVDGGWYVEGRQLYRVRGGVYIGTASLIAASPEGACAFARNEGRAALLGVLDAQAREAAPVKLTVAVPGRVRSMGFDGNDLLVVSTVGVHGWTLRDGALHALGHWMQPGLRDAVWLDRGQVLAVGEHGRSVVELDPVAGHEAHRHETAGGLDLFRVGSGSMLARGTAGVWLFEPGRKIKRREGTFTEQSPRLAIKSGDWSVTIGADGLVVIDNPLGETTIQAPDGGRFTCLAGTPSAIWLGHDHGIIRLLPPEVLTDVPRGLVAVSGNAVDPLLGASTMSVRLGGPVLTITPLVLGRGVAYATADDGFGMVIER